MSRPADDTTKPSRLNRKRKKRWKIANLIESGLTDCVRLAILFLSSTLTTRNWRSVIKGAQPPKMRFFCAYRSALHIMSGWARQSQDWPVSFFRYANLVQSGSMIGVMLPGYSF